MRELEVMEGGYLKFSPPLNKWVYTKKVDNRWIFVANSNKHPRGLQTSSNMTRTITFMHARPKTLTQLAACLILWCSLHVSLHSHQCSLLRQVQHITCHRPEWHDWRFGANWQVPYLSF